MDIEDGLGNRRLLRQMERSPDICLLSSRKIPTPNTRVAVMLARPHKTERKLVVEIVFSPCLQDRLWVHKNKGPLHNMHPPGGKTEDNHQSRDPGTDPLEYRSGSYLEGLRGK